MPPAIKPSPITKEGHGIFQTHSDLSACYAHQDSAGTRESECGLGGPEKRSLVLFMSMSQTVATVDHDPV